MHVGIHLRSFLEPVIYVFPVCDKSKKRMRNPVLFLQKCEKTGTLVGPTFFGTFFCQKYGENSALTKKIEFLKNRQRSILEKHSPSAQAVKSRFFRRASLHPE